MDPTTRARELLARLDPTGLRASEPLAIALVEAALTAAAEETRREDLAVIKKAKVEAVAAMKRYRAAMKDDGQWPGQIAAYADVLDAIRSLSPAPPPTVPAEPPDGGCDGGLDHVCGPGCDFPPVPVASPPGASAKRCACGRALPLPGQTQCADCQDARTAEPPNSSTSSKSSPAPRKLDVPWKAVRASLRAAPENEPEAWYVQSTPPGWVPNPLAAYSNIGPWNDRGLTTREIAEAIAADHNARLQRLIPPAPAPATPGHVWGRWPNGEACVVAGLGYLGERIFIDVGPVIRYLQSDEARALLDGLAAATGLAVVPRADADEILETLRELYSYARDSWDWKYGEEWRAAIAKARKALGMEPTK